MKCCSAVHAVCITNLVFVSRPLTLGKSHGHRSESRWCRLDSERPRRRLPSWMKAMCTGAMSYVEYIEHKAHKVCSRVSVFPASMNIIECPSKNDNLLSSKWRNIVKLAHWKYSSGAKANPLRRPYRHCFPHKKPVAFPSSALAVVLAATLGLDGLFCAFCRAAATCVPPATNRRSSVTARNRGDCVGGRVGAFGSRLGGEIKRWDTVSHRIPVARWDICYIAKGCNAGCFIFQQGGPRPNPQPLVASSNGAQDFGGTESSKIYSTGWGPLRLELLCALSQRQVTLQK